MKKKILNVLLFLITALPFYSISQTLDQSSESSSGIDSGANAANPQGQSFTAGVTGDLTQISLRLGDTGAFTPGDFQLTIYNGNGYGGAVLNTTTLNISSTSSGLTEEYAIVLSSPVSITAGNMYTFDFRGLGSASVNFRANFANYGPGGYYFASGNTGLYNTYDIWFKTFVSPPSSPATHLNFDGIDDYVTLTHYERPETLTIEAMIKTSSFGQEQIIGWAHPTNAFTAEFKLDQNKLTYGEWNQSLGSFLKVESSIIINDNNWHHVAAVRSGNGANNVTLYVDGVSVGSGTVNHSISSQTLNIGAYTNATTDQFFNGDIDELRVWNVALSQTEIQNRASCELQGNETGLVAYYNFNQGNDGSNNSTETTLVDITSNANNGSLQGFALNGTISNWLAGSPVVSGSIVPSNPGVTTPVVYNQGDTATPLTATVGTNGTGLLWYTTATGGTGSTTAPTPSTSIAGSTSFWVSSVNTNGCESERVEIVVTVNAVTPATHLDFDGVDDYVSANNNLLPFGNNSRTVEAWVRTSTTTIGTIVNYGNQSSNQRFGVLVDGSGQVLVIGEFNDYTTSTSINDNNWHHVAVTFDGILLTIYVDGVNVGSTNKTYATTGDLIGIGSTYRTTFWGELLDGEIDEVRFWNVARTQSEIQNKMSCELEGTETGLVGYYKFNQGNGAANNSTITTLSDSSGNGNTGVLNGFALNGSSSNWLDGSSITTGSNCSTLSLDAFTTELDFSIYPNPTKNTVSIDLKDNNKAEITIYDLNGRVIKSQIIKSKEKINMSELANGIYLIKIITNGEIITKRVVKQ
ncbi:MAG TPA: T9SS type A sorting domain-containing protein [Flavobacteriaceae bacterium]|nr:T9SS type A sorting domain-containing protein [Flavobacteriaceae bacterium]